MVVFDLSGNFHSPVVAGFGPFPACSRQIAAESGRVEIPFLIWQWVVFAEPSQVHVVTDCEAGVNKPCDQFVA